MTRQIAVVNGGLRNPSSSRLLADELAVATVAALGRQGEPAEATVIDLREHAHAIADALLTGFPTGELAAARDLMTGADAVILVTPTFQASFSGLFKSFLDLIEADTLRGMPVLLAATGGTERHSLVIDHALRPLVAYLGALAVPTGVYAASTDFGGQDAPALSARVHRAAGELAGLVTGQRSRRQVDPYDEVAPFAAMLARLGQGEPGHP